MRVSAMMIAALCALLLAGCGGLVSSCSRITMKTGATHSTGAMGEKAAKKGLVAASKNSGEDRDRPGKDRTVD